jgi:hypothetical protein
VFGRVLHAVAFGVGALARFLSVYAASPPVPDAALNVRAAASSSARGGGGPGRCGC